MSLPTDWLRCENNESSFILLPVSVRVSKTPLLKFPNATRLAEDVKDPTHLPHKVGHGVPGRLWSGLVLRVGASHRVNSSRLSPLDKIVKEKLLRL